MQDLGRTSKTLVDALYKPCFSLTLVPLTLKITSMGDFPQAKIMRNRIIGWNKKILFFGNRAEMPLFISDQMAT